jgi:hypothetical protein
VRSLECCSIRVVRFDATLLAQIDIGYDEIGTISMAKVLAAMLVFEAIDSLMFGSLRADEMMHCHRGLATISCVFSDAGE